MHEALLETLRDAQRFGFFGDLPVELAADHASAFVDAIGAIAAGTRIVDLGSGGGLPGLVIADAYREASITLVDRREKRTDFLRRAVSRLDWSHVDVRPLDVADLVRAVAAGAIAPFDVATARGFGPPEVTLGVACDLVTATGRIVISEPPTGDRWDPDVLAELHLTQRRVGAVSVFERG